MARSERPQAERNAGAFMGPDIMVPVPMEPLGTEHGDGDRENDEAEPRARPRRGWLQRIVDRLTMRPRA
jgi:hypothetical protein